ncbi:MAG: hypothetical protein ACFB01_15985 [Cohaesibacteraceae bacterium]
MIGQALNIIAERTVARWLIALLLIGLIAFPWVVGEDGRYFILLLMTVFIFATLGHAWNLLAGFCGLLSFGIQVYIGLAGFSVAVMTFYMGVPVWWAMLLSIFVTTAFAWLQAVPLSEQFARRNTWIGVVVALVLWALYEIIIAFNPGADVFGGDYIRRVIILFLIFLGALPLLKLQGAYFAVATWLIAASVASIFNDWRIMGSGGGMTIPNETTVTGRYYAGQMLAVVSTAIVAWLLRSRYGQALTAVRDDDEAATAIGIDIRFVKTVVFLVSAPMAGLAAALFYIDQVTITAAGAFGIQWSAYAVFVVVAGGMGTLVGPIIGAVLFIFVQRFLVGLWGGGDLTLGIAAVLLILLLPRGVAGLIGDLREKATKEGRHALVLGRTPASRQGSIVSATLIPSSPAPYLLPGTPDWRGLWRGMTLASERLTQASPDVIVLLDPDPPSRSSGSSRVWRVNGLTSDPAYRDFGEIAVDVRLDRGMTRLLSRAGVPLVAPRTAEDISAGVAAALSQLDPKGTRHVVLVDASGQAYEDAAELGRMIGHVARESGRKVALVGLSGLSGSAHETQVEGAPGLLASEADDLANRQILGWLEHGDLIALGSGLSELSRQAHIETGGSVLAALAAVARGPAEIIGYSAIFGAGAAVVSLETKATP